MRVFRNILVTVYPYYSSVYARRIINEAINGQYGPSIPSEKLLTLKLESTVDDFIKLIKIYEADDIEKYGPLYEISKFLNIETLKLATDSQKDELTVLISNLLNNQFEGIHYINKLDLLTVLPDIKFGVPIRIDKVLRISNHPSLLKTLTSVSIKNVPLLSLRINYVSISFSYISALADIIKANNNIELIVDDDHLLAIDVAIGVIKTQLDYDLESINVDMDDYISGLELLKEYKKIIYKFKK